MSPRSDCPWIQLFQCRFLTFIRRNIKDKMRLEMAVRIQCWWRLTRSRLLVSRRKIEVAAASIIMRSIHSMVVYRRYLRSTREYLVNTSSIRQMQRWMRRCLARRGRRRLKESMRVQAESTASATLATTKALCSVQLMLVAESLERLMGKKPSARCGLDCSCYGPVQALFVHALGKRGHTDFAALASNRMDGSSFLRLAQRVEGLFSDYKQRSTASYYGSTSTYGQKSTPLADHSSAGLYGKGGLSGAAHTNAHQKKHLALFDAMQLKRIST